MNLLLCFSNERVINANWSIMDLSKVDYENDIELLDDICS